MSKASLRSAASGATAPETALRRAGESTAGGAMKRSGSEIHDAGVDSGPTADRTVSGDGAGSVDGTGSFRSTGSCDAGSLSPNSRGICRSLPICVFLIGHLVLTGRLLQKRSRIQAAKGAKGAELTGLWVGLRIDAGIAGGEGFGKRGQLLAPRI